MARNDDVLSSHSSKHNEGTPKRNNQLDARISYGEPESPFIVGKSNKSK